MKQNYKFKFDLVNSIISFSIFSNCHEWAFCTEKDGSYECECHAHLVGDGFECEDIPECENSNTCHSQATCTEMIGGFACDCNSGYYGDGQNCRDIDECQENANNLQQVKICSYCHWTNADFAIKLNFK